MLSNSCISYAYKQYFLFHKLKLLQFVVKKNVRGQESRVHDLVGQFIFVKS